jgi:hypothetical protein
VEKDAAPLVSLRGSQMGFYKSCFPWSNRPFGTGGISEEVSPEVWLVSCSWIFLPSRQFAIEVCGCSLPDCPWWSDMLLFLPGSSWITPQPQLWFVSSSPNNVGQFSFVHHPVPPD